MLGYAESPADLARGRDITELRTGDLARRTPEGLVEIVGRANRIAKVFGLRVDLGRVERALLDAGVVGARRRRRRPGRRWRSTGRRRRSTSALVRRVVEALGVPAAAVVGRRARRGPAPGLRQAGLRRQSVHSASISPGVTARPRSDGSTRHEVTARRGVRGGAGAAAGGRRGRRHVRVARRRLAVLRRGVAAAREGPRPPAGRLAPDDGRLARRPAPAQRRRRGRSVETNVLLRAAAIVMIVGSHSNLFMLLGGAHLLVGLAGFNFARFQLTDRPRRERVRSVCASIARIVVPSVLWLTFAAATSAKYELRQRHPPQRRPRHREWTEAWHYWFIEALVWTLVASPRCSRSPRVDRLERRPPSGSRWRWRWSHCSPGTTSCGCSTATRLHPPRPRALLAVRARAGRRSRRRRARHRLLVSGVVVATVPGFFEGGPARCGRRRSSSGMLLLVWVPSVRVPALVAQASRRPGRSLASTSTWSTGRSTRRTSSACRGWPPGSPWPPASPSGGW